MVSGGEAWRGLCRQLQIELVQQQSVLPVRPGMARQDEMPAIGGWQMHIDHLEGGERLQDGAQGQAGGVRPGQVLQGDEQPGLQPVGPDLPRPNGHGRGDRPPRTPRRRDRVRRTELPNGPIPPDIPAGTCSPRPCSGSAAAPSPPTVDLVNARIVRKPHSLWTAPAGWKTRANTGATVIATRQRVFHPALDGASAAHTAHRHHRC